ncbi:tRNA (adenosine(37)-N6)-threonylcarbamoyltransferase complex transferase subunit TsaD [Desulfopila inferna]|uniref:tRNA (adenosine(37)-N6)-threonylcarbamoyltransferase complex transferase subunit TsaD n=1 Tax=Desulfopila inferna TaxID=468528 RepID=UPI001965530C|nr:tRNA (adenosine(37)-N6)-threonylcarbamoyltransferase complex transferase subunit TsaD [Desulfopila inferna]MBM9602783.1 tRNA (adenosine(37)-N6)-threonylcarbamoyltransferase complex transferase subunit TsaD [Desulfopila inferna]
MLTLGIESSCDDTAAAVLEDDTTLLSSVVSSQDAIHSRFGGVVPELASRKHLESIHPIVEEALARAEKKLMDIDLIAATRGPGLIGSLLVGFSYAKALSYVSKIPYVGVDHLAGHLLSIFLEEDTPAFPYIALIISGGTTSLFLCRGYSDFQLLGRTRDDAAGEAFDKVAKILDLGYPGGPIVAKLSDQGDKNAYRFPRAWLEADSVDFSFSGLKTAVLNQCHTFPEKSGLPAADICASFQEAVVDVLVTKTMFAAEQHHVDTIVLGGGVAANGRLRQAMMENCGARSFRLFLPQPRYCTDNAAMIAMAGYHQYRETPSSHPLEGDVYSRSTLG